MYQAGIGRYMKSFIILSTISGTAYRLGDTAVTRFFCIFKKGVDKLRFA
jgi:hypothetical protein